jgi:pilus assembly protein CpaC
MRRTNRVPQMVLWSILLGVAFGPTVAAQQPPAQPLPPPVPVKQDRGARGNALVVPINGTQRLQMSNKGRIERVLNPKENIARVTPVLGDPTSVLVTGLDAGAARITLIGEGGAQETVDIVVQFDVEYLRTLLAQVVPTAAVKPIPGSNNQIILTGTVAHAEDIEIIMRTATSVVGGADRVVNAMRLGGAMQVQLDTVVARVNRSLMRQFGFDFLIFGRNFNFNSTIGNINVSQMMQVGTTNATQSQPVPANFFLNVFTRNFDFMGYLQALKDEQLAKLLTEPRLVTMSGQPALLHSGGQQAIPQPQGLGTVGVTFTDFGTDLTFIPIVLGNGKIHLDITTVVSQIDPSVGTSIQGTTVPGRADQKAHTVVELEDGQTIAIGGLIQHTTAGEVLKVPVLGDLPIIGSAFSIKTYTDVEEELVILVTPHIVDAMACNQLPKLLPGEETRSPDDYELFLEGILEAPRGPRTPFPGDWRFVPAYKNGPTAGLYPCAGAGGNGQCGSVGHNGADPAGAPPIPGYRAPVGNAEAKPVPPVAATPPAGSNDAAGSPAADAARSEGETNKAGSLPAALPGAAGQESK